MIFTVYRESNIITSQPRPDLNVATNRIPIPSIHYTLNSPTTPRPFIPQTGLDYLQGLASIHIQQTFELNDCELCDHINFNIFKILLIY